VYGIAFSPDGELIATAPQSGRAALWRPDGTKIAPLRGHAGTVYDAAFSHDGRLVATAGTDGTLRLWEVPTGRPAGVFPASGPVASVDFSADDRYVAFSGFDSTSVFELATRTTILTLPGGHARFAPAGHRLATAVGDDVALWDCDVCDTADELLALADERDVRPLTADERRTYLHEE
jgi:WD40 repeat protein